MLVQRMPEEGGDRLHVSREDLDDAWRAAVILLGSLKDSELLDRTLSPGRLLHRIYGTVGVRPLQIRPIRAVCRCSPTRTGRILGVVSARRGAEPFRPRRGSYDV